MSLISGSFPGESTTVHIISQSLYLTGILLAQVQLCSWTMKLCLITAALPSTGTAKHVNSKFWPRTGRLSIVAAWLYCRAGTSAPEQWSLATRAGTAVHLNNEAVPRHRWGLPQISGSFDPDKVRFCTFKGEVSLAGPSLPHHHTPKIYEQNSIHPATPAVLFYLFLSDRLRNLLGLFNMFGTVKIPTPPSFTNVISRQLNSFFLLYSAEITTP